MSYHHTFQRNSAMVFFLLALIWFVRKAKNLCFEIKFVEPLNNFPQANKYTHNNYNNNHWNILFHFELLITISNIDRIWRLSSKKKLHFKRLWWPDRKKKNKDVTTSSFCIRTSCFWFEHVTNIHCPATLSPLPPLRTLLHSYTPVPTDIRRISQLCFLFLTYNFIHLKGVSWHLFFFSSVNWKKMYSHSWRKLYYF